MNQKFNTIEEGQVSLQFNTSLYHFKKQLELSRVNESLVKDCTEFFVLDFNGMCYGGHR